MDLPFYRRSSGRICLSKSETLTSIVAHLTVAKPGCLEHFPGFILTNFTPIVTRYLKESWNASRDWPLGSALGTCAPVRVNTESVPAFKALQQHHRWHRLQGLSPWQIVGHVNGRRTDARTLRTGSAISRPSDRG